MNKQLKKSGNNNNVFRKLTITNTVITYVFVVTALFSIVYFIENVLGWDIWNPELANPSPKRAKILALIMGINGLLFLGSLALGIVQTIFAKKKGMITNKVHYQLAGSLLIISTTLTMICLGFAALTFTTGRGIFLDDFKDDETLLRMARTVKMGLAFMSLIFSSFTALSSLVSPIFNTVLCVKTK